MSSSQLEVFYTFRLHFPDASIWDVLPEVDFFLFSSLMSAEIKCPALFLTLFQGCWPYFPPLQVAVGFHPPQATLVSVSELDSFHSPFPLRRRISEFREMKEMVVIVKLS